jgi:hypothetical protein
MSNGLAKCAIATPKPRKKSGCDKRPEVHADGLENDSEKHDKASWGTSVNDSDECAYLDIPTQSQFQVYGRGYLECIQ